MPTQAGNVNDDAKSSSWSFERTFALRFYECVGSPRALRQSMLLKNEQYYDLNDISISISDYREPKHFAEDYQVAELLKKSRSTPGTDQATREAKARSKFIAAEARNAATNDRLMGDHLPDWFGDFSYNVLRILGPLDRPSLEEVVNLCGFGPGVNVGVRGDGLVPSIKYDTKPVCTDALSGLLASFMPERVRDYWGPRLNEVLTVVLGNHHFTVPKRWDVDRCAAKEPLWNSFLQTGIGRKIMKRLLRFGVNLHDQRLNQWLASMAYDWDLATVDLSSASDTLSRVLVWLALCYNGDSDGKRWFHLLNAARSPQMRMPCKNGGAEWRVLEMFASMGNGFTFPLETVIFLALARCTVPRDEWMFVTAYGDDIILPQRHASTFVERLEYLGFQVNRDKTCLAGTFFESCGTDWYMGTNVRPFYLHRDPENPAPYTLQAANALRAWCLRVYGYMPTRYVGLWKWCKGQIPTAWRNPVPSSLGDTGLNVSLEEALTMGVRADPSAWSEGFMVKHVSMMPVTKDRRTFGVLTHALSQQLDPADSRITYGMEPIRRLYGRIKTETSVVLWKDDFSQNHADDAERRRRALAGLEKHLKPALRTKFKRAA